jgi:NADH-quinone oxidoreductase subunit L
MLWAIALIPLAVGVVLLLTGRRWPGRSAGWFASAATLVAFGFAVAQTFQITSKPTDQRVIVKQLYEWIVSEKFHVDLALRADPLSMTMALVVTGIGSLILIYSIGYMDGDPRFARYFAYKSLFVAAMLLLVLGANYLVMYIGWEGVGLASYLLIGFWFERPAAAAAAKKAFVVTRIGDAALLIGLILIWARTGSLDFDAVFHAVPSLAGGTVAVIGLLLLAGACGKSAQMPLHTWLPDAMEGPTPTSALIHAATMVTAGVYLIVRSHVFFDASGAAALTVAVVGVVTAVYAGLSAIGQDDIKRALAYSTISQIGFMFLGAGVGAYGLAIFLLVAHAFFKALLFLSAGSVIHGLHDEQDMMKMGGLRRAMPFTAAAWVVGWAAMVGIPPLSGFFAKDELIGAVSGAGRTGLYVAALAGAFLTALYASRQTALVFFGPRRYEGAEPHEPGWVMRVPMALLGVGAVVAGVLGLNATSGILVTFLAPSTGAPLEPVAGPPDSVLVIVSVVVALAGVALAWFVYLSRRIDWVALRVRYAGVRSTLRYGFHVDGFYGAVLGQSSALVATFMAYVVDRRILDGFWNGLAGFFGALSTGARRAQAGLVRVYAAFVFLGVVGVLGYLAIRWSA